MPLDRDTVQAYHRVANVLVGDPHMRPNVVSLNLTITGRFLFTSLSVVSSLPIIHARQIVKMCVAGPGASHRREAISLSPAPTLAKTSVLGATANFPNPDTRRGKESPSYATN